MICYPWVHQALAMMIWAGNFYPPGMPKREWLPRVRELKSMTEKTFIFANNHWQAQAVGTIRQLRLMLD